MWRDRANWNPQPEPLFHDQFQIGDLASGVFHFNLQFIHHSLASGNQTEFAQTGKQPDDLFDTGRKNVDAANHYHVIHASNDSAVEPQKTTTFAAVAITANEITRAITDRRGTQSPQAGQHKFGQFSLGGGLLTTGY